MGTQSALAAMFKTIMTTSGFDGEQQRESIRNTVWFLSEHNKHFDPEIPDQEELECPANDNLDLEPGLQFIISKPNPYFIGNILLYTAMANLLFIFRMQQLIPPVAFKTIHSSYCI